jgi:hypothetical protein
MQILHLVRQPPTDDGVFGLVKTDAFEYYTVEDDWKQNRPRESCIPSGVYQLKRTIYYRHGYETFEVTGVPNRSRILFHPANTEEDVEGCIGLGLRMGVLAVPDEDTAGHPLVEKRAVVASREAFRQFMGFLAGADEAQLRISWLEADPPVVARTRNPRDQSVRTRNHRRRS